MTRYYVGFYHMPCSFLGSFITSSGHNLDPPTLLDGLYPGFTGVVTALPHGQCFQALSGE